MNEQENDRSAVRTAEALRQAMEESDRAARQFLSTAGQVQSAYTLALGRVKTELNQLSASLWRAAAVGMNLFANLLNAVQPVADALSRLTVRLFGVTYWKSASKSAEGTAGALGKVAKATGAVAKAQRDLYSFDEITRVSAPKSGSSRSSGGGGGRGGGSGGGIARELVHISGLLEDWADRAREILAQIWQPFRAAWESQGAGVLQAARSGLEEIVRAASAVGESWLAVWTDGSGEQVVRSVLQLVQRLCQAAGGLASRFREAWTAGETGKRIFQDLTGIVQNVLDGIRDMAAATAAWADKLDFSGLVGGFADLVSAIRPLTALLMGALSWGYTNVLLPLAKWAIQSAGPAMLKVLTGAVNLLTAGLNLLKPVGMAVWENLLKPMGNWAGTILISGLNNAAQGFQTLANVISGLPAGWESLRQRAASIWGEIQNAVVGASNSCRTGALSAFSGLSQGVGSQGVSLKQKTSSVWSGVKSIILGAASSCRTGTLSAFSKLNQDVGSQGKRLSKKLKEVFGGLASGLRYKLSGIKSALTDPFRNGFNGVIDLLNRVIRKINSALKFSWKAVKVLGQVIVPAGSVTLAQMPTVSRLAQGGVTQGATLSLIGEAGREAVLPLDRNTGWMDQLADRLAQAVSDRKSGETRVEVYVGGKRLAEQVVREVNSLTRQSGRCPIYI